MNKQSAMLVIALAVIAIAMIAIIGFLVAPSSSQKSTRANGIFEQNTIELPANTVINYQNSFTYGNSVSGSQSCPIRLGPTLFLAITNASGFSLYNISNITDFVIAPGRAGQITYEIERIDYPYTTMNPYPASKDGPLTVENRIYFYNVNNRSNINTLGGAGINVYITPPSEMTYIGSNYSLTPPKIVYPQSTYSVKLTLKLLPNATQNTYGITLGPAYCGGGPSFLFTVGNEPYNGAIPRDNNPG
jgi:hypothetical protein